MLDSACVAFSAVFMSDDDDVSIVPASKRRAIGAKDTGADASPIGKPVVAKKVAAAKKLGAKDTGAVACFLLGGIDVVVDGCLVEVWDACFFAAIVALARSWY